MELTRLTVPDVDFAGGALLVRQGKGRKDRVIPIGARSRGSKNTWPMLDQNLRTAVMKPGPCS